MLGRGHPGAAPSSADTSGRAATATSALTGTSSSTVQVSSAPDVCRTWSRSAACSRAGPARTGTTTAVSAPPITMS